MHSLQETSKPSLHVHFSQDPEHVGASTHKRSFTRAEYLELEEHATPKSISSRASSSKTAPAKITSPRPIATMARQNTDFGDFLPPHRVQSMAEWEKEEKEKNSARRSVHAKAMAKDLGKKVLSKALKRLDGGGRSIAQVEWSELLACG